MPLRILCLAFMVALMPAILMFWWAYADSTQRTRDWFTTRKGAMGGRRAASRIGARAMARTIDHAMPARSRNIERDHPDPADRQRCKARSAGFLIGTCHGVPAYLSWETGGYHCGPSRMGKTSRLVIPMVVEAAGPVVATSSRIDLVEHTIGLRRNGWHIPSRHIGQKGGGVYVFDPLDISRGRWERDRLVWDPLEGCQDPRVARSAADALVGTVGIDGSNRMWHGMAVDIVQALLLAAALDGRSIGDVYEWSQSVSALEEPKRILKTAVSTGNDPFSTRQGQDSQASLAADDWRRALEALDREDGRIVGSKMLGVTGAFSALAIPEVRARLSPDKDDPRLFDMTRFLTPQDGRYGTVYLLNELRPVNAGSAASAAAFTAMFLNQLRDRARRIALANPDGSLEDPAFLILDEIDNIEPWNGLPQMYTASQAEGLIVQSFHQGRTSAKAAFGDGERQMWDNAAITALGGIKDKDTRRDLSAMCGRIRETVHDDGTAGMRPGMGLIETMAMGSGSRRQETDVIREDQIRELPEDTLLMFTRNDPVAVIETIPWWKRGWIQGEEGIR